MPTAPPPPSLASAVRRAAIDLLDSLAAASRQAVTGELTTTEWHRWTYPPGERPGLRLGALAPEQRERAVDLLQTAFSPRGVADLSMVLRTEEIRRELDHQDPHPHPHLDPPYWLRVLGPRRRTSRGRGGPAATISSRRPPWSASGW